MDIILQLDESFRPNLDLDRLEKALQAALQVLGHSVAAATAASKLATASTVTLAITDTETIQELNHQYRGVNAPTDVLAFENTLDPDFPEVDQAITGHLGDIIIAYPVAQAQALAAGHTPQDEIILLAVHGLLHLLGFDHDTPANKQKMWAIQHQIMASLNLAHVQPTEN